MREREGPVLKGSPILHVRSASIGNKHELRHVRATLSPSEPSFAPSLLSLLSARISFAIGSACFHVVVGSRKPRHDDRSNAEGRFYPAARSHEKGAKAVARLVETARSRLLQVPRTRTCAKRERGVSRAQRGGKDESEERPWTCSTCFRAQTG